MNTVLNHDHGRVDNQSEVNRSQTHQAGGHTKHLHHAGRKQHGKRNRQSGNQTCPKTPQHHQQNQNHQRTAVKQIIKHRGQSSANQCRPIVSDLNVDPFRHRLFNLNDAFFDSPHNFSGVFADQHHHKTRNSFASSIACHRTLTRHGFNADFGHITN